MSETMEPLQWTNEKRKVKDLVPYEFNPRILSPEKKEKLKKSLEKFNLAEIPAVNTDNVIIAGHQRIKVLMELGRGDEEIDVRVPNRLMTEQEFKEYNIISNIPTGFWDLDVLAEQFDDIDLEELGLNVDDIVVPHDDFPRDMKPESEEHFNPTPKRDAISKQGDIYEFKSLDKGLIHRLICGSSTEGENYTKLLEGEGINLTVTDPPYNVDYRGNQKKNSVDRDAIHNDNLPDDDFHAFLLDYYTLNHEHSLDGAGIYVFHADTEGLNFRSAFKHAGFKLSQCLIWNKNSSILSRSDYHWKHEPILYGWRLGAAHNWYSDRKQKTVLDFDRPMASDDHPTMKPNDLKMEVFLNGKKLSDTKIKAYL